MYLSLWLSPPDITPFFSFGAAQKEKKALGKEEKEAESTPLERPPAGGFSDGTYLQNFSIGMFFLASGKEKISAIAAPAT